MWADVATPPRLLYVRLLCCALLRGLRILPDGPDAKRRSDWAVYNHNQSYMRAPVFRHDVPCLVEFDISYTPYCAFAALLEYSEPADLGGCCCTNIAKTP